MSPPAGDFSLDDAPEDLHVPGRPNQPPASEPETITEFPAAPPGRSRFAAAADRLFGGQGDAGTPATPAPEGAPTTSSKFAAAADRMAAEEAQAADLADKRKQMDLQLVRWHEDHPELDEGTRREVMLYSAASGRPADDVKANLPDIKKEYATDGTKAPDWRAIQEQAPNTFALAVNEPIAAPVVRHDFDNLGRLEWTIGHPWETAKKLWRGEQVTPQDIGALPTAIGQSVVAEENMWRMFLESKGIGGKENEKAIAEAKAKQAAYGDFGTSSWWGRAAIGAARMLPMMVEDKAARVLGGTIGAAIAVPAGAETGAEVGGLATAPAGGEGALPGAVAGGVVTAIPGQVGGELIASFLFNYYHSVGEAYDDLIHRKDATGKTMDPALAQVIAEAKGVGDGVLMAGLMTKLAQLGLSKSMVEKWVAKAIPAQVQRAFAQKTIPVALAKAAARFTEAEVSGAATMAAQTAVNTALDVGARKYSNATDATQFSAAWSEIGDNVGRGIVPSLQDMFFISAFPAARAAFRDAALAKASQQSADRLAMLTDSARGSELLQQMPEEAQRLILRMKQEQGAVQNTYHPIEQWDRFFQEKKLDPAEMAAAVIGDGGKAYQEAKATGGDLVIPIEKYVTKLARSEFGDGLREDTRLHPEEDTPREAKVRAAKDAEAMQQEAQRRAPELELGHKEVFDFIRDQAMADGQTPKDVAEANAKIVADHAVTMALRLGVSVQQVASTGALVRLSISGDKGEAIAQAARQRFRDYTNPELANTAQKQAHQADFAAQTDEEKARRYHTDSVSGLLNKRGAAHVQHDGPWMAIRVGAIKAINDAHTHETADAAIQEVARVAGEASPQASRVDGDIRIPLRDKAHADAIVKALQENPALAGLPIGIGTGGTIEGATKRLNSHIEDRKALKADHPARWPGRGEMPAAFKGVATADLPFKPGVAEVPMSAAHIAEVKAVGDKAASDTISHEPDTGALTKAGDERLQKLDPKSHTMALDMNGLRVIHERLEQMGLTREEALSFGDMLIKAFTKKGMELGGKDVNFAHLGGDEYLARSNDPESLKTLGSQLEQAASRMTVTFHEPRTGKVFVYEGIGFGRGIGTDRASADEQLNHDKASQSARGARGPEVDAGRLKEFAGPEEARAAGYLVRSSDGVAQGQGLDGRGQVVANIEGAKVTYNKEGDEEPRGSIGMQLDPSGRPVAFDINILKGDKSTFAHEIAHFLSRSLHELATSDLATPQLQEDYAKLLKWMGYSSAEERNAQTLEHSQLSKKVVTETATPEEAARHQELTAKEERFSHAWEQYLAEGKAPSKELTGVFSRFRSWMRDIYQGIQNLQAQFRKNYGQEIGLSDDIRQVFDRMLAADQAIKEAKGETGQTFEPDPEALKGMTPAEQEKYLETLRAAKQAQETQVARRQFELENEVAAEDRSFHAEQAAQELDQQPVYRAMRFLQHGDLVDGEGKPLAETPEFLKGKDGEPLKLNRAQFVADHGKEAANAMPPKSFDTSRKGGVSTDELAQRLGYETGQEMVDAIRGAEPRDAAIERETQARMDAAYKPTLDGMKEAAMASAHSADAALATLQSLRGLAAQVDPSVLGRVKNTSLDTLRKTARRLVEGMRVGDVDPARFAREERKAALKAAELWGKGKKAESVAEGERRLFNQILYREARDQKEALDKAEAKMTSVRKDARAGIGKADPSYLDAHDSILAAVGLAQPNPGTSKSLDGMMERVRLDARDVAFDVDAIRDLLANPKGWKDLTTTEAQNVADAVANIKAIAKNTLEVEIAGKRQGKTDFIYRLAERVMSVRKPLPQEAYSREAVGAATKARKGYRSISAGLQDIEALAEMMDGGAEGPAHDLLINSRLEARDKETQLTKRVLKQIQDIWETVPNDVRKLVGQRVDVAELLPPPQGKHLPIYTRDQLWMLFLNWGNEGNRQRVRDGNRWQDANVEKALSMLTKPELTFLQGVLDAVESLGPEMMDAHERRTGLRPDKVEATPIVVNGETYRGGYFPIKYDARFNKQGMSAEALNLKDLYANNYVSISAGHAKDRLSNVSNRPVELSWGVVQAHLAQVIHDITYGDWVKQTGGVLLDARFKDTVEMFLGKERERTLIPWLQDVANDRADSVSGHQADALGTLGDFSARRLSLKLVGLNIPSYVRHMFDPLTTMADSTPTMPHRVAAAYLKLWNPAVWNNPEFGLSRELDYRHTKLEEGLSGLNLMGPRGASGSLKRAVDLVLFRGQMWIDHYTSRVAFKAAYDQARADGATVEEAVQHADRVLDRSFPSPDIATKAPILRSKLAKGAGVMLYGYMSKIYNLSARATDGFARTWWAAPGPLGPMDRLTATTTAAGKLLVLGAVGAMGTYAAGKAFQAKTGAPSDKDKEGAGEWVTKEILMSPLDTVPFVGSMAKSALSGHKVNPANTPLVSVLADGFNKLGELVHNLEHGSGHKKEATVLGAAEALLSALLQTGQVKRTMDYAKELDAGTARPRGLLDVGSGLIFGKKPGQPTNPLLDLEDFITGKRRPQ